MLEDLGFTQSDGTSYRPIDEYVWLGGRPVMAIRARINTSGFARQDDGVGNCYRLDEMSACSSNFLVTDNVSRPIVTLDRNMKVASVGEYEPFGHVNRVPWFAESAHPYGGTDGGTFDEKWTVVPQPYRGDLETSARVHFMMVDSEACTGAHDVLQLENASGSTLSATNYSGYHQGDVWTDWVTQPADGGVVVHFSGDNANQSNACSGGAQYAYAGFVVNEVEYRKWESGALPYQPLFRAAGQYFDSETDLFQNWNRYYDAETGTYLSPEPMLQRPKSVRDTAMIGMSTPVYAYANNNPVRFSDPTGLSILCNKCATHSYTVKEEAGSVQGTLAPGECRPIDGLYVDPNFKPDNPKTTCDNGQKPYVFKFRDPGEFDVDCNGNLTTNNPFSATLGLAFAGWHSQSWASSKGWPTP
jgi:RHS repeat-associated protein